MKWTKKNIRNTFSPFAPERWEESRWNCIWTSYPFAKENIYILFRHQPYSMHPTDYVNGDGRYDNLCKSILRYPRVKTSEWGEAQSTANSLLPPHSLLRSPCTDKVHIMLGTQWTEGHKRCSCNLMTAPAAARAPAKHLMDTRFS